MALTCEIEISVRRKDVEKVLGIFDNTYKVDIKKTPDLD